MAEDPQPMTLQQRIAALNQAHIGRLPGDPPLPTSRQIPQIPTRRPIITKSRTVNNPPEQVNGSVTNPSIGNQPSGPPPIPSRKVPPPLPTRKTLDQDSRRGSSESTKSNTTTDTDSSRSTLSRTASNESASRIKAPAWGECHLPELPPRGVAQVQRKYSNEKPKYVNRVPAVVTIVSTPLPQDNTYSLPHRSIPPKLPSRKPEVHHEVVKELPQKHTPPISSAETLDKVKRSALSFVLNKQPKAREELSNSAVLDEIEVSSVPPPVPLASRPDLSTFHTNKPKLTNGSTTAINGSISQTSSDCLVCRDFSAPDQHATLFPRNQVTSLQTLAIQLTSPFPSQADKARAIFTWLHHNISYDAANFSRGTVKSSTPQSTLQSGLAVCEGYAALFTNLATHAGIESIVICGHGKGYGYAPLAPGSPIPPFESNHAWNAVKLDNGEWKLIESCWGAGYVQGSPLTYFSRFEPYCFSMPNEEFGFKHFPANKEHFFLPGGQQLTWQEYMRRNITHGIEMLVAPTVFTDARTEFGIGERTLMPLSRYIKVSQEGIVRFQFGLICPHWTLEHHQKRGLAPVFIISTFGSDGTDKDNVPMNRIPGNSHGEGDIWTVDIPAKKLGRPGQTVTLFWVKSFGDRQNARGLTVRNSSMEREEKEWLFKALLHGNWFEPKLISNEMPFGKGSHSLIKET